MNKYKKYCPNVFVVESEEDYSHGYSLIYAKKDVNVAQKNHDTAIKLWGDKYEQM